MTKKAKENSPDLFEDFKPKTKNQSLYQSLILENDITLCYGPAGTGKTAVASGVASRMLRAGSIKKIIITRPAVQTGRGLGFLPGTINQKVDQFLIPVLQELNKFLGERTVKGMMEQKIIEILPLELIQGRNFQDAFMILDEAENCYFNQLVMFVTRIGNGCKMVLSGDERQSSINDSGWMDFIDTIVNIPGVGHVEMEKKDIVRHGIIGKILEAVENAYDR